MTKTILALSLGFGTLILAAQAGFAQSSGAQCGQREKVVERLASTYGETRRGMGLANNRTVMEVFASEKTGTWTITVTLPNGMTCLVASGEGFEALAETLPTKGSAV